MASRLKEDEKNERIIRGLLKLPENRRCINCNSLGPQYVCTSFLTFVCTTCSGIHREFTHRVKSVSMAKFTSEEVTALQEGGNQKAREIYLKEWDSEHRSGPDGSNVDRLRDFIKHVYVERRFSGDKKLSKPPSGRTTDKDDSYGNKKNYSHLGGSRSPSYEDSGASTRSDPSRYSYDERRSPGYDQESRQYNEFRRIPAKSAVVNDWRREDRLGNDLRDEDRRASDGELKGSSNLYVKQTKESPSPPLVRPVRELLGDNTSTVLVVEHPKSNLPSAPNISAQPQTTSSSVTVEAKTSVDIKSEPVKSLIDFDADPEPPAPLNVPQPMPSSAATQPPGNPASQGNNWASFDFPTRQISPQTPPNPNSLESVFSQFPASSGPPASVSNPTGATSFPGSSIPQHAGQRPPMQQYQRGANIQHYQSAPNVQTSLGTSSTTSISEHGKAVARKELPQDLFTSMYPSFPVPMPMWQTASPHPMAYNMHYPTPAGQHMLSFVHPPKSVNPFDGTEPNQPQFQPHTFPSMAPLQNVLPNVAPPTWLPAQTTPYHSLPQRPQMLSQQPQLGSFFPGSNEPSNMVGSAYGDAAQGGSRLSQGGNPFG